MNRRGALAALLALSCGGEDDVFARRPGARSRTTRGKVAAGGTVSAATPATILAGATFRWLEADLGETLTNDNGGAGGNNVIDAVADQGPGGFNASQTTSARPRKEDKGWNGEPCWVGDGTDDRIASTGTSIAESLDGEDAAFTIWIAFQTFATGTQLPFSFGNSGLTTDFLELFQGAANYTVRKNDGVNVDATGSGQSVARHRVRIETAANGQSLVIVLDDVDVTTSGAFNATTVAMNVDALFCLRRSTFSTFMKGRIRAMVVLAGVPTAAQRTAMDTYFAGLMTAQTAPMVVFGGDSHIHTAEGETTMVTLLNLPGTTIINNGVPGDTLLNVTNTDVTLLYRYLHSNFDSSRSVNVYYIGWGANDLETGRSAADIGTDLQAAITAINTAQPAAKVVVCTYFDNNALSVGEQIERAALNLDITTNAVASWGADAVHNRAGLLPEAATDLTYFEGDGKHLNATGEAVMVNDRNGFSGLQTILVSLGCS